MVHPEIHPVQKINTGIHCSTHLNWAKYQRSHFSQQNRWHAVLVRSIYICSSTSCSEISDLMKSCDSAVLHSCTAVKVQLYNVQLYRYSRYSVQCTYIAGRASLHACSTSRSRLPLSVYAFSSVSYSSSTLVYSFYFIHLGARFIYFQPVWWDYSSLNHRFNRRLAEFLTQAFSNLTVIQLRARLQTILTRYISSDFTA